ncbi:hypothetical protein NM688_g8378 [Phlebia brevispora]|uniref:Uncharacterized protein n=1 Tax=Phlebia brevispora TaxID=194682 RepID=A0ACC1RT94_9APHY|nr:hypothetical protein NM688_g8378 [Phlebia brevispora]
MLIATVLSLFCRVLFQQGSLSPKKFSFWIYVLSLVPSIFLSRYLERIGSPRHDPTTGTLISSGEDLSHAGILEWCFDVVYITWACQVGSGLLGPWVWWLYLVIPGYAVYKLWGKVISPFVLGRSSAPVTQADDTGKKETLSKRQEKLRKRSERGDPRVQQLSPSLAYANFRG